MIIKTDIVSASETQFLEKRVRRSFIHSLIMFEILIFSWLLDWIFPSRFCHASIYHRERPGSASDENLTCTPTCKAKVEYFLMKFARFLDIEILI